MSAAKKQDVEPILVRRDEAARMIGFGITKMDELLKSGEIPSFLIGRNRMIEVAEIRKWIERQKAA